MAAPRVWTVEEEQAIRDGNAAGASLHSIAKDLGASTAATSRKAKAMGLTWDRTKTAGATHARVLDAKARRAELQLRALDRVEALYARLEAEEFTTLARGSQGRQVTKTFKFVPPADERDLAVTIRTHLDASLRLDAHDTAGGATAVIGILQATAAALGITDEADTEPTT